MHPPLRARSSSAHVSPYAPEIAFVGRIDTRDPVGPRFGWSGTEIEIGFRVSSVRLELRDLPRPPDPRGAVYGPAYRSLVDEVRRDHPRAHVICAVGPASDEWPPNTKTLTSWRAYVTRVVDAYRAAGDLRVHYLEFGPITKEEPRGCDSHAGLLTHARLARGLTSKLKEVTGW